PPPPPVQAAVMAKNLLKNPSGEELLDFWELTENGGSQWKVEEMPGDCGSDCGLDGAVSEEQVIGLLVGGVITPSGAGWTLKPPVNVEDWYCGRSDCGAARTRDRTLRGWNQEVIEEFKPDPVTHDPDSDECCWKQVSHTFSEYGPGLRFITFEHGGQDTKFWDGWFGVRVTGSSVTVEV
ncbi:hypothetical protein KUCAC02_030847, partial [Chaenocephalus aceratus]